MSSLYILLHSIMLMLYSGENNYCSTGGPPSGALACASGFYAATGWDPTTGWGSVTLGNLATITGYYNSSYFPNTTTTPTSSSNSNSGLSAGAVAGIVIAVLVVVGAVVGLLFVKFMGAQSATAATYNTSPVQNLVVANPNPASARPASTQHQMSPIKASRI
jgi:hypothetical protein